MVLTEVPQTQVLLRFHAVSMKCVLSYTISAHIIVVAIVTTGLLRNRSVFQTHPIDPSLADKR